MPIPRFTIEHFESAHDKQKHTVVWRAAEILRTFMSIDEPDVFDPILTIPSLEAISESDDNYNKKLVIGADDDDLTNTIIRSMTMPFQFSEHAKAWLENMPLLIDDTGKLQQLTEPGFTTLVVCEDFDIDTLYTQRTLEGIGPETTQLIFRLPWHIDGPAVFQGFTLQEDSRIDDDPEKLEHVAGLLEDFVDFYRHDIATDTSLENADYVLLQVPSPVAQFAVSEFLSNIQD